MVGVCIAIYMSGLIVQNCLFVPIQTAQNSLKNLSGDIWIFLKTELAIYSGDCCFSNEVKGKKIPQNWKPAWRFCSHPFFSALWKNNTQQERSKLWIYAKLLGTIWNEEFLSLWDLDFSHLPAALFPFPTLSGQDKASSERKSCGDWGPNYRLLFVDPSWESASN